MRNGRRRRSGAAGNARPDAGASATGNGGLWGWVRKHPLKIIGAALAATLTAWLGGFFGSATGNLFPSGPDAFCALSETVRASWPFGEKPASDKFTILIATIDGDDASHTYTYAVGRAFSEREGIARAKTCRVLRIGDFSDEDSVQAVAAAQRWLRQRSADLLIGGRLLKTDDSVDLWFIGNDGGQGFKPQKFTLDANLLKADFANAASDQLVAVALAAVNPATEQQGRYLVAILRPVANRLRSLLRDAAGFSGEQRAQLQFALGLGLFAVGEQSGRSQDLVDAATAYRAALTEYTREHVPLQWAATQNNLGNVLSRLGERESGTAQLEEAVAAYRAALTEWTRERVPFQWALTQENLAIVFRVLATRADGEARLAYLADALAAVDGALEVYREGNAAFYIEKAERLRAMILAEQVEARAP